MWGVLGQRVATNGLSVSTDCKSQKVVVKGAKADPIKVQERVQRKSHRKVELISPIPKPPAEEEPKKVEDKQIPKHRDTKKQEAKVIMVVLKLHMHCEACAQEIKKRILRMEGVESAEADFKGWQVTVKGVFEAPRLVEDVYRGTGKRAVIVKQHPKKKDDGNKGSKDDKKGEDGGGDMNAKKDKKAAGGGAGDGKDKKDGGVKKRRNQRLLWQAVVVNKGRQ